MHGKKKIYAALRKHLNNMPVGYPATFSGVELRILESIFTPVQACLALLLTHVFEPAEKIRERADKRFFDRVHGVLAETGVPVGKLLTEMEPFLDEMAGNGGVFRKTVNGRKHYALVPFVVGMFEFQVSRLTPKLYEDAARYFREGFALEYLSTAVSQMRVIPVAESIGPRQQVAAYDEVRALVEAAGERVGVADCLCRKGKDLSGDPCKATDRRSLCIGLRDYFDMYHQMGWLRRVTPEEAFEILAQSEKEGLVLQSTNEQNPQAICACCSCCCGILATLRHVPNRAEFAGGNYQAIVDPGLCVGCGKCLERCHVGAITECDDGVAVFSEGCIGCGVCVPVCKKGALSLVLSRKPNVPPLDTTELYETIAQGKSWARKARTGLKVVGAHLRAARQGESGARDYGAQRVSRKRPAGRDVSKNRKRG